jgi:hypothetical protein
MELDASHRAPWVVKRKILNVVLLDPCVFDRQMSRDSHLRKQRAEARGPVFLGFSYDSEVYSCVAKYNYLTLWLATKTKIQRSNKNLQAVAF